MLTSVLPLLTVDRRVLLAISTINDVDGNPYSIMLDTAADLTASKDSSERACFRVIRVGLSCKACTDAGDATKCTHTLTRLPPWKSRKRQNEVEALMKPLGTFDREVMGQVASNTAAYVFRPFVSALGQQGPVALAVRPRVVVVAVDPSGGGAQSDYAIVSGTFYDRSFVVGDAARASECPTAASPRTRRRHSSSSNSPRWDATSASNPRAAREAGGNAIVRYTVATCTTNACQSRMRMRGGGGG